MKALILTPHTSSVRQWRQEFLDKTNISSELIGEYSGSTKQIKPITLATYQILTARKAKSAIFPHLALFESENWGLIIYDEVHLLPAPIFQMTANIQARRRLGLTATLLREDGKEDEVFSLIGPKKFDVPWRILEQQGWIATANCHEVRVPFLGDSLAEYAIADKKHKFRIASSNPCKIPALQQLLELHRDEQVLIIGMYLNQIKPLAAVLDIPIVDGSTPQTKRDQLFAEFRSGKISTLVLSKVGNFSLDLPEASVAIQISGMFGSRQEEAQRLGRILRPKKKGGDAHFYSIITRNSEEARFALRRQLFLIEQGYDYQILDAQFSEAEIAQTNGKPINLNDNAFSFTSR